MQIVVDQPTRLVLEARNERLPVRFALAGLLLTLLIALLIGVALPVLA